MNPAADPMFVRITENVPLYVLSSQAEAGLPEYWAGLRTRPGTSPLPASFTLGAAWANAGTYVFCGSPPSSPAEFVAALDAWLDRNPPLDTVRFLWLTNPDTPQSSWSPVPIRARPIGNGADMEYHLLGPAVIVAGNCRLTLVSNTRLVQRTGTQPGVEALGTAARFGVDQLEFVPRADATTTMPWTGPTVGAWTTSVEFGAGGNPHLTELNPQLRYTTGAGWAGPGTAARTVSMPLLHPSILQATGQVAVDPAHPTQPGRTGVGLGTGSVPPLPSHLRTPRDYGITLVPFAQSPWPARLVVNVSPRPGGGVDYYLTADGTFRLSPGSVEQRLALDE
jgi:hypothetical protein